MATSVRVPGAGAHTNHAWWPAVALACLGIASIVGLVVTLAWAGLLSLDLLYGLPVAFAGFAAAVFCFRFFSFLTRRRQETVSTRTASHADV
jgi:hypothetical protein